DVYPDLHALRRPHVGRRRGARLLQAQAGAQDRAHARHGDHAGGGGGVPRCRHPRRRHPGRGQGHLAMRGAADQRDGGAEVRLLCLAGDPGVPGDRAGRGRGPRDPEAHAGGGRERAVRPVLGGGPFGDGGRERRGGRGGRPGGYEPVRGGRRRGVRLHDRWRYHQHGRGRADHRLRARGERAARRRARLRARGRSGGRADRVTRREGREGRVPDQPPLQRGVGQGLQEGRPRARPGGRGPVRIRGRVPRRRVRGRAARRRRGARRPGSRTLL
ncbi:MAG: hypothetical protein AVDCRST_MAG01-01-2003, partial [uncultured Rubrobacteraceae bacterium]